jgi:hypothetical protein
MSVVDDVASCTLVHRQVRFQWLASGFCHGLSTHYLVEVIQKGWIQDQKLEKAVQSRIFN